MSTREMPRKAVIARIADSQNLTKVEAEKMLQAVLNEIAQEIAERGRFHIAEIGSVSVVHRRPRRFFDPRNQTEAMSAGSTSLKINMSKAMRTRIEGFDEE